MDNIYCNICGVEFKDYSEMEGHQDLAHERDPLGLSSDFDDVEDPADNIPFRKIMKE